MIGEGALPVGEITFYSLVASNTGMAGTLVGMVWSSYLLFPLLQGLGGTWREAKAFDQQMRMKMPAVHWHLFMMLLLTVLATVTLPIINILIFHYLMAWLYVATRELAGGISENSTETAKAPTEAVANPI
jgi:hypothetical protein